MHFESPSDGREQSEAEAFEMADPIEWTDDLRRDVRTLLESLPQAVSFTVSEIEAAQVLQQYGHDLDASAEALRNRQSSFDPTHSVEPREINAQEESEPLTCCCFGWDSETRLNVLCGASIVVVAIGLLLLMILLPLSYVAIERQSVGFIWYRVGRVDTSVIYGSGNHFVGLDREAITFPTTRQTVCFSGGDSLSLNTASGQVITIEMCFDYVLNRSGLDFLFRAYGQSFDLRMQSIAYSAIKNAAATMQLEDFVSQRPLVTRAIRGNILVLLQHANITASVPESGVLLGFVTLPNAIISRSLQIFEQTQLQLQQAFELQASTTRFATMINVSTINATTALVLQQATAISKRMTKVAKSQGLAALRSSVGTLIASMSQRLGIRNVTAVRSLAKFLLLLSVADHSEAQFTRAALSNITIVTDPATHVIPRV